MHLTDNTKEERKNLMCFLEFLNKGVLLMWNEPWNLVSHWGKKGKEKKYPAFEDF